LSDRLEQLSEQLEAGKDVSNPPLHLWHPPLSGDIDIQIRADGSWLHEGGEIKRQPLVNLFASILRREEDGDYYLVTPVEKWRIRVECLPLVIIDFEVEQAGTAQQVLTARTNTDRHYTIDAEHPLYLPEGSAVPAVRLDHGLAAGFNRAAWYRLAELCEETDQGFVVLSSGERYILG
jgi:hypothetical protein